MPAGSYKDDFLPLSKEEALLCEQLEKHVAVLADGIGERNIWHPRELEAAAEYIEKVWNDSGYDVAKQEFKAKGIAVKNLEAELTGISVPEEIVVIGAHYDSVVGSSGANDNASGVAALLEIARLLSKQKFPRTIRFAAFVNEEPPFFKTSDMGSRVYASRSRQRGDPIKAMISLETIGYYSDGAKSQRYPSPLNFFYPDTGNFIAFVGNISSRQLVRNAVEAFRRHTDFPSEGAAAPGWLTGIGWSDHWAFWKEGYPAIMVTDTALFRYEYYHSPEDTPEKITYDRMARVVGGIARVVGELAFISSK
jgi:Zn-dependent M28 family amino/carboxypeptidase